MQQSETCHRKSKMRDEQMKIARYVSSEEMCVRKGVDGANACHGP